MFCVCTLLTRCSGDWNHCENKNSENSWIQSQSKRRNNTSSCHSTKSLESNFSSLLGLSTESKSNTCELSDDLVYSWTELKPLHNQRMFTLKYISSLNEPNENATKNGQPNEIHKWIKCWTRPESDRRPISFEVLQSYLAVSLSLCTPLDSLLQRNSPCKATLNATLWFLAPTQHSVAASSNLSQSDNVTTWRIALDIPHHMSYKWMPGERDGLKSPKRNEALNFRLRIQQ